MSTLRPSTVRLAASALLRLLTVLTSTLSTDINYGTTERGVSPHDLRSAVTSRTALFKTGVACCHQSRRSFAGVHPSTWINHFTLCVIQYTYIASCSRIREVSASLRHLIPQAYTSNNKYEFRSFWPAGERLEPHSWNLIIWCILDSSNDTSCSNMLSLSLLSTMASINV